MEVTQRRDERVEIKKKADASSTRSRPSPELKAILRDLPPSLDEGAAPPRPPKTLGEHRRSSQPVDQPRWLQVHLVRSLPWARSTESRGGPKHKLLPQLSMPCDLKCHALVEEVLPAIANPSEVEPWCVFACHAAPGRVRKHICFLDSVDPTGPFPGASRWHRCHGALTSGLGTRRPSIRRLSRRRRRIRASVPVLSREGSLPLSG